MNRLYTPLKFALVRTANLPFACFNSSAKPMTDLAQLETAIAVASPSLSQRLSNGIALGNATKKRDLYKRRMSSRTIPFGLFASVSLAEFSECTTLCRQGAERTRTRVDMSALLEFVERVEKDESVKSQLVLYTNPEAFVKNHRVWLSQLVSTTNEHTREGVNLKETLAVKRTTDAALNGIRRKDLVELLCIEFRAKACTVENLINDLCSATILISELRMPLSLDEPSVKIRNRLQFLPEAHKFYEQLASAIELCETWDASVVKSAKMCVDLTENIRKKIQVKAKDVIQLDSAMIPESGKNFLNATISHEIATAAEICLSLSPSHYKNHALTTYRKLFQERYQIGREISLLELLDATFGLGSPYQSSLSSYLPPASRDAKRERTLKELIDSAEKGSLKAIELNETQLQTLRVWAPSITDAPPTVDIFAFLASESREEIDQGNYQIVLAPRIGEAHGTRTLGRFAHILGAEALELMRLNVEAEIRSDVTAVWATCDFWPTYPRAGNVSIAPSLEDYSIVARCSPNTSKQNIPLSEIIVGVEDGQFYARWTKTGQRIRTRPSSMLNPKYVPEPLRFLTDISSDGMPALMPIDWGTFRNVAFIPRLTYQRIVIQRASWGLLELKELSRKNTSAECWTELVSEWKRKMNVPDIVQILGRNGDDHWLTIDLSNQQDLLVLKDEISKGASSQRLVENMACHLWHSTGDGEFLSEIVTTLVRSDLVQKRPTAHKTSDQNNQQLVKAVDSLRPPGSEWLYFKFQTGRLLHDRLVTRCASFLKNLEVQNLCREWFFVKYREKEDQLRLRIRVNDDTSQSQLISSMLTFANSLVKEDFCSLFAIETYDREVERYGGKEGIAIAEKLFCLDSLNISQILNLPSFTTLSKLVVGVLAVDNLLTLLGLDLDGRSHWVESRISALSRRSVSKETRMLKPLICSLLVQDVRSSDALLYSGVLRILEADKQRFVDCGYQLRRLHNENKLSKTIDQLCTSFVHMRCNRLCGTDRQLENKVLAVLAASLKTLIMKKQKLPG